MCVCVGGAVQTTKPHRWGVIYKCWCAVAPPCSPGVGSILLPAGAFLGEDPEEANPKAPRPRRISHGPAVGNCESTWVLIPGLILSASNSRGIECSPSQLERLLGSAVLCPSSGQRGGTTAGLAEQLRALGPRHGPGSPRASFSTSFNLTVTLGGRHWERRSLWMKKCSHLLRAAQWE